MFDDFVTIGYAHLSDFVIPGLILKRTVSPEACFSKVPESRSRFSNLMITELFYSHLFLI